MNDNPEELIEAIDGSRYAMLLVIDQNDEIKTLDLKGGMSDPEVMMVCFKSAVEIATRIRETGILPSQSYDIPRTGKRPTIWLPPDLQRKLDTL